MRMAIRAVLAGALCVSGLHAQDPTAESILERHLAARGGLARLKAMASIRVRGVQVLMPAPLEIPMVIEQKKPNFQRVEMTVDGMTEVQTWNGQEGWRMTPWAANKAPVPMDSQAILGVTECDFFSPYVDWREKGWKAEYLGTALAEGQPTHKVKLSIKTTEWVVGYFDRNGQEVQREHVFRDLGNELTILSVYGDYRRVDGIVVPYHAVIRAPYRGGRLKLFLDRVEINPVLPDQRFAKP